MNDARTRIKFCGMTSLDDALLAANLGVDAIGLIFHAPSSRNIAVGCAKNIAQSLPPFIYRVGVFVNESHAAIQTILQQVPLDLLQFHGQESADFCRSFNKAYIKVIHVGEVPLTNEVEKLYPDAAGFLFDTGLQSVPGGGGQVFNWNLLPRIKKPCILAGGLNPDNVAEAIVNVQPYAVDVVSGVERAKGIKDPVKMRNFIKAVAALNRTSKL